MFYLAFVVSLIAAFFLGYNYRGLTKRVIEIEKTIAQKIDKPKEIEDSPSEIIDPYDSVQQALYEAKKQQDKLNAIK